MMPVYVVIPTTARIRKDTHLFLKVKLDQYSARSKFLLIINGTRAIARQNWSSYQYWGCSMTLWMGTKHRKLPANKAKIGPLKIETWCNTEDSVSLPKLRTWIWYEMLIYKIGFLPISGADWFWFSLFLPSFLYSWTWMTWCGWILLFLVIFSIHKSKSD